MGHQQNSIYHYLHLERFTLCLSVTSVYFSKYFQKIILNLPSFFLVSSKLLSVKLTNRTSEGSLFISNFFVNVLSDFSDSFPFLKKTKICLKTNLPNNSIRKRIILVFLVLTLTYLSILNSVSSKSLSILKTLDSPCMKWKGSDKLKVLCEITPPKTSIT